MNVIIYVIAKHDVNGNPRRGWIIPGGNEDGTDAFVDEGYTGRQALYSHYGVELNDWAARIEFDHDIHEVMLKIPTAEYNWLKKRAK